MVEETKLVEESRVVDIPPGRVTNCENGHIWTMVEQDPKSELVSLACLDCWAGVSVAKENVSKYLKG